MAVLAFFTFLSLVSTLFSTNLVAGFFDFLFVDTDELILAGVILEDIRNLMMMNL